MFNFSLMGAGRIGRMHADIISSHPECNLKYIYDINEKFAVELSKKHNAVTSSTSDEALTNNEIDAVLIASATPTHIEFITKASRSGKAVFCEKPIDLDIIKVNSCFEEIKNIATPIQIGFNRRFDNSHKKLQEARKSNEIGQLELIVITSRDPEPPGLDYLKAAGGFFRDTTIHDFDLSRFILGDDPIVQISAFASTLISEEAREIGDHDTAMFILKSKNGVLIHINNSRRAVYGYDQRVEIFGSNGMMISGNQSPTSVEKFTSSHTKANDPIHYFFIERYAQAYRDQFNDFVQTMNSKSKPSVSFEDGRNALIIANAAYESYNSGKVVDISYE
jgi:myo-inositol 2-dehydrogenase/D-chiro-inositol 1-dehydrogenase|tara:strand:- start:826 stop:1830 length:1005 start_codon:yes stop_codon:yes gene_type:complete